MQNINNDLTLKRNYLSKYRFLINEYEQVKRGEQVYEEVKGTLTDKESLGCKELAALQEACRQLVLHPG